MDYSFFLTAHVEDGSMGPQVENRAPDFRSAMINVSSAAYREGEITLEGKKHRLLLIDFNSNGRFDDELKKLDFGNHLQTADGRIYPAQCDQLLVDPVPIPPMSSPYELALRLERQLVSKMVNIDGRFYNMELTPAGDQVTLTPSRTPLGYVKNPGMSFRAVVYGDQGFLNISDEGGKPIPLPVGNWKVFSYTIDRTGFDEAKEPEEKETGKPSGAKKETSLLAQAPAKSLASSTASGPRVSPRTTLVTASMPKDTKAVEVRKGQTVTLPIGPPYKPVVSAGYPIRRLRIRQRRAFFGPLFAPPSPQEVRLQLSLVGSGGEICSDLQVNGSRPAKPEFTITTPDGDVVQQGSFEPRPGFTSWDSWYTWRVPTELADEYRVKVQMKAGPFQINESHVSVIK